MTNDLETSTSYYREIREIVAQAFEDAAEYQREPNEVLWETLDGHEWVIYTYKARQVLARSDNSDYAIENFGIETATDGSGLNWSALAFGAMYGDCMEIPPPEDGDGNELDWNEIPAETKTTV